MTVKAVVAEPPEVVAAVKGSQELTVQSNVGQLKLAVATVKQRGINSEEELTSANDLLRLVVNGGDRVDGYWKPKISAANALHKMLLDAAKPFQQTFKQLREDLSGPITRYLSAKKQRELEEQAALDQAVQREQQRKLAEAQELAREGRITEAREAVSEAQTMMTPVVPTGTVKLEGTSQRENWDAEVTDFPALVHAVATGQVPLEALEANLSYIKRAAKDNHGLDWPGVKATVSTGLTVRRN